MSGRFLVVRAGGERVGLDLAAVREVIELPAAPQPVPARAPALRGVVPRRGRYCVLLHLGALLTGTAAPEAPGDTAVVVELDGVPVALEVDDVEAVVDRGAERVGAGPTAWATGVWRVGRELVTALDLDALAERVRRQEAGDGAG